MECGRACCVVVARFALAAWVGGATLFVINGVRLVMSAAFDSPARDHMALIRFPTYYLFGTICVGLTLLCLPVLRRRSGFGPVRWWSVTGLVLMAAVLMGADYFWVYRPLADMITPPGQSRPAEFHGLHRASLWMNTAHVGLSLLAALLLNWPARSERLFKGG
jgi:hypothetical protein